MGPWLREKSIETGCGGQISETAPRIPTPGVYALCDPLPLRVGNTYEKDEIVTHSLDHIL